MSNDGTPLPPQWSAREELDFATGRIRVYRRASIFVRVEQLSAGEDEPREFLHSSFAIDPRIVEQMSDEQLIAEITPKIAEALRDMRERIK